METGLNKERISKNVKEGRDRGQEQFSLSQIRYQAARSRETDFGSSSFLFRHPLRLKISLKNELKRKGTMVNKANKVLGIVLISIIFSS